MTRPMTVEEKSAVPALEAGQLRARFAASGAHATPSRWEG